MINPKEVLEYLESKEKEIYKCNCKEKLTKDEFYAKLYELFKNFPDYFNNKYTNKYTFKEEVIIREFIDYIKKNI